jgi:MFS family permease
MEDKDAFGIAEAMPQFEYCREDRMRRIFQIGVALSWLALPLTALRYLQVWDRLPAYMATHFDAANRPNGWMSRETAFWYGLGITAFLLTIFTSVLYVAQRKREVTWFSWALLAFFYLVIALIYSVNSGLVDHALYGRQVNVTPLIIGLPIGIVVLVVMFLATERGAPIPSSDLIAEETHARPAWALIFVAPLLLEFWVMTITSRAEVRFGAAVVGLVLLGVAAFTWSGFRYCFTREGLEIRSLGFRLRSIPITHIEEYRAGTWSALSGYGIRGLGNRRAYVWGNRGVRIKTSDGEIFLGHSEPERVIRDLDMMKSFTHIVD